MAWQALAQAAEWPSAAVRDTVAAIARQAAYDRASSESLWTRLTRVFRRWIESLFDLVGGGSANGRTITIVLLIGLGVLIIARIIIALRASRDGARRPDMRGNRGAARDPWVDAQRFAARGDFTQAAHALLAALIVAFASRGEVRVHSSKTAGDYARELARSGSRATPRFDAFRRRYDRVIYGDGVCDGHQYHALLADAGPLLGDEGAPA